MVNEKKVLLPRICSLYVDDMCAVDKRNQIQTVLECLNAQYDSIKFTYETEIDGKLPISDSKSQRVNNKIQIGIYHKPTANKHNEKDNHYQSPISEKNINTYIKEVASVNGFSEDFVDVSIRKHSIEFISFAYNRKRTKTKGFAPQTTN